MLLSYLTLLVHKPLLDNIKHTLVSTYRMHSLSIPIILDRCSNSIPLLSYFLLVSTPLGSGSNPVGWSLGLLTLRIVNVFHIWISLKFKIKRFGVSMFSVSRDTTDNTSSPRHHPLLLWLLCLSLLLLLLLSLLLANISTR